MSILRKIMSRALIHPRKLAVVDDQRRYSYFEIAMGALHVARQVKKTTCRDKVGIMLPTGGGFVISVLGVWLARKVPVPLNYLLSQAELDHVVADSGIDTIITAEKMVEAVRSMGVDPEVLPGTPKLLKIEQIKFKGLPPAYWPRRVKDDDLAVLLYTSGTSGKPKGVMLTQRNLKVNVEDCLKHGGLGECDTFLGVLPQFHSFGLTVLTLLPLYCGAQVVYSAKFVPRRLVDLIKKHRPHVLIAVPSMYGAMLSVKKSTMDDWSSLRYVISGGEPLPYAVNDGFKTRYGVHILEGYGLTETSPCTNWSTPEHNRDRAVGLSLPHVKNLIVDGDDKLLGADQEGEILIAGDSVMKGYYNLPELTDQVMVDLDIPGLGQTRCFRTGDIGKIDDQGYLYITGRKKEMLIIAGENVFPREIEEVLNKHPAVHASAVIGRPDDSRGEVPIAFVELEEGQVFDQGQLREHCRGGMASFKVPKEIRLLETLPRNPTGKILRRALSAD